MNMIVRTKLGQSSTRQRRGRRGGRELEHSGTASEPVAPRGATLEPFETPSSRRRQGGPSQDTAVYNCQCGYVFEEHVSTTVGCPHCGHTQAW